MDRLTGKHEGCLGVTLAQARAAEAIELTIRQHVLPPFPGSSEIRSTSHFGATMPELASAALRAALTDPDDPDWLKNLVKSISIDTDDDGDRRGMPQAVLDAYERQAEAVAAAVVREILGTEADQ